MQNSRDDVSCTQHLEVMYAFKKSKNLQLFENLNDAYIILMPMFATQLVSKVKMKRIIIVFMRNRELISILKERNVFRWQVAKFCESFSRKRKLWCSILSDTYNYNIDAYVCNIKS